MKRAAQNTSNYIDIVPQFIFTSCIKGYKTLQNQHIALLQLKLENAEEFHIVFFVLETEKKFSIT